MKKRVNNTQLPDERELREILEKEAKRALPSGKDGIHYPQFETMVRLLDHYSIATDIFHNETLDIFAVVQKGAILLNKVVSIVMAKPIGNAEKALFDKVYAYVAEEDTPQKSDLIFVFGGKSNFRAEKAAQLYKKGLGTKILVSGKIPLYAANTISEAKRYKAILMEHRIAEEVIILEENAITVADNVRASLNLMDSLGVVYKSIILVNSPYAQRRGWAIWKKYTPDSVTLYRVNSQVGEEITKEQWYKKEHTLRIILNEFIKMRASVVYNTA